MRVRYLLLSLALLLLACNTLTAPLRSPTPPLVEAERRGERSAPDKSPQSTPPAIPFTGGHSRSDPAPYGATVETLDTDFRVLETWRGAQAWERLHAANQFNEPAPPGAEWLLLEIEVANRSNRPLEIGLGDFLVTGSRGLAYFGGGAVPPDPSLDDLLSPGEKASGHLVYLIQADDENLLLLHTGEGEEPTFLALSPGAKVEPPPVSDVLSPLGKSRSDPAPAGEPVSTDGWNLWVEEALRGEAAWEMLRRANLYNPSPGAGEEYLLVRLGIEATHTEEKYRLFWDFGLSCLGSTEYEASILTTPYPPLDMRLFPGATFSGWVVFLLPEGEDCILAYQPFFDFEEEGTRYLALP